MALVVLFALVAVTLSLSHWARVQAAMSGNAAAAIEASAVVHAAEQFLLEQVASEGADVLTLPETDFQAIPIGTGWFWVLRPDFGDSTLPRFGLIDESAKLNINEASLEELLELPDMTEEMAAAIVDWRDSDDEAQPNGAESQHYLTLAEPYRAKNGPFESVEELLLVRGITPAWLLGEAGSGSTPGGGAGGGFGAGGGGTRSSLFEDAVLVEGAGQLLTVHSVDPGLTDDGEETINANEDDDRDALRDAFAERLDRSRAEEIVDRIGRSDLEDKYDLYVRASLTPEEFDAIEDLFRTDEEARRAGLINVNTAPREVLRAVEDLPDDRVEALLAARPAAVAADPTSTAWVVETLGGAAVGLADRLTGRPYQYSAEIVAASGDGRAFQRVRIVIDRAEGEPRIVYRRDVSSRGWPLDVAILESLRSGNGVASGFGGAQLGGVTRPGSNR